MITVSDIHGVKQYTLHQFIKVFIFWIITAIAVIIAIGVLVLSSLDSKVDDLNDLTRNLQHMKKELEIKSHKLEDEIHKKEEMLASMDEHLSEIEKMIGLEPDIESAFLKRAEHTREKLVERIKEKTFTVAQLSILNHSIPNGVPVEYKKITDRYGYRIHPILHKKQFHVGIDLSAKFGMPIYAPADGVVEYSQYKGTYGNFLLLNHPFGFKTAYGHLSKFAVHEGDYVSKGDIIGYVGTTGRSTGPHLHYEVRYLNKWLDPEKFLGWSSSTYVHIMTQESQINWVALMHQIEKRLQLYTVSKIEKTKSKGSKNGNF
jgi:septal ring factor EnvC (AmiA/AmiB activator)